MMTAHPPSFFTALLVSAALVSTPAAPAASARVTVRVENLLGQPVTGALVWVNVDAPSNAYADASGNALVTVTTGTNYLMVARHAGYGRAPALFPFIDQDTNITITLPVRTSLRIASYNMYGMSAWSDAKVKALARMLWTVQPDIVFAQETRTTTLALSVFQPRYLFGYTNAQSRDWGDIRNALVSIFPLQNVFSAGTAVMTRDLFGAEASLPGVGNTTLMSVHYKALKDASSAATRDIEALFTAGYCSNLNAQAKFFMLGGDMNDDVGDPTWLSHVHQILTNYNTGLRRLEPRDDAGNPATYTSFSYTSRLDYIYLNQAFLPYVQAAGVARTDTMTNRPVWLRPTSSNLASDHSMIYADIALVPEPACGVLLLLILLRRRVLPLLCC
ncbi:MAG: hypothetical protein NTV22_09700 [bacterium]|nr:hypothetical protein [bacterium]